MVFVDVGEEMMLNFFMSTILVSSVFIFQTQCLFFRVQLDSCLPRVRDRD